ncbi:hypothetical protein D9756_006410 [Leucocoprinus leucothites]|uniref:Uncharacterized protein n=1 Tax=Leucocoprinus leucothites TaxID=201217 RepID=A0A8H5LHD0_9AGAR|nr:hypothetical protein D9756_006410 [Leucoagaricus leucothites]
MSTSDNNNAGDNTKRLAGGGLEFNHTCDWNGHHIGRTGTTAGLGSDQILTEFIRGLVAGY